MERKAILAFFLTLVFALPVWAGGINADLINAARQGNTAHVQALIASGADVNATDGIAGGTALMYAATNGHAGTVQALIDAGADLNMQQDFGKSAMDLASDKGHSDIVQMLIEAGATQ
jgi:ankyrin repeat protein